jgi:prolyl oligopeptidase
MRFLLLLVLCIAGVYAQAPKTKVQPVTDNVHGMSITDPYRWLENQEAPETRAWIEEQAKFTETTLSKLAQREHIKKRLGELMRIDVMGPPTVAGGRYFFSKRRADQNQSVLYLRQGLDGQDTVLIDPNPLSPDHTTSLVLMDVSLDGKVIAYGFRQGGEDETTLKFFDVDAHKDLAEKFPRGRYEGVSIKPDRSGVYYSRRSPEGPRVYYHDFGKDTANDPLVFGKELGTGQFASCDVSLNGRWLTCLAATGSNLDHTEIYVQDLHSKDGLKPIVTGIDARFEPQVGGDTLYALTNWNAPNSKVIAIDLLHPARENWKDVIPEGKSVLESLGLVGGRLVGNWLENVHTKIEIRATDGKLVREIKLPALGVASGPFGRFDSDEAFYSFTTFGRPTTYYRYDMTTAAQSIWSQAKIPFDSDSVEVKQVWYESKDKTKVPMYIAYKKGLKLDGNNPTLLTGYGGFNVSLLPTSSATTLAWLDMGGVFAQPNLRGGGEFGEAWHRAGMLEKKQNVFDDFIAAAEYLIREKYTSKAKLAIEGGSNGGLLVGAALTQRPDLFQAVICWAPLLDMVRYDKFKVAKFWVPEYGTADNAEQFKVLYKYSPYHHVEKGVKYPAVMFVTGDFDTRVDPLHARKMAALVQASTASGKPVLLHYDFKAGHSGGLPIAKQIEDNADQLAFLGWQLGIQ